MKKLVVNHYDITSEKIGKGWDMSKIVVLSDLHNNVYGINLEEAYQKILMLRPDFIVIAGDMYNGEAGCDNKRAESFLTKLAKKFPIYYGLGNHEYRMMIYPETYVGMAASFEAMIRRTGIHLLKNESVELEKNGSKLMVSGLMIDRAYYKKLKKVLMAKEYMNEIMAAPDTDKFQILIAHHPAYFENYAAWGADLVFSGHYHGGMARLPFIGGVIAPSFHPFPKYDMGEFKIGDSTMILSAGIGTHTINLRPFNPPEIVVVTLHTR